MTVQSNASRIVSLPLRQLVLSPLNVRTTDSEVGLAQLAHLLAAEGVLQNLAVVEEECVPE